MTIAPPVLDVRDLRVTFTSRGAGEWAPVIEPGGFSLAEHERFLEANAAAYRMTVGG